MSRRLPPEQRRRQLVAAAVEVFAERPEEDVRMEDLAAAAGVTRNLLFHYFDGKAALHREAVLAAIAQLAARHDTSEERPLSEKVPANLGPMVNVAAGLRQRFAMTGVQVRLNGGS